VVPINHTVHVYIHSTLPNDSAIIYDNLDLTERRTKDPLFTDHLRVDAGLAHVSPRPFGSQTLWGWGSAWRSRRTFVGRVDYGVTFRLWDHKVATHRAYGGRFRRATVALLSLRLPEQVADGAGRAYDNPWFVCPDDVLFYILNMCPPGWFEDTAAEEERARGLLRDKPAEERRTYAGGYGGGYENYGEEEEEEDDDDGDDDDDEDYVPGPPPPPQAAASAAGGYDSGLTRQERIVQALMNMPGM
jgi:hypothetical protein